MTSSLAAFESDASSIDGSLRALLDAFTTMPLTILQEAPGPRRTALLADVLLPALSRRPVAPARDGIDDVVVHFDAWDEAPLAGLARQIDAVLLERCVLPPDLQVPDVACGWLAAKLQAAAETANLRFLIVLDGLDVLLGPPDEDPGTRLFVDELVDALNSAGDATHVLVTVGELATSAVQRFIDRVDAPVPLLALPAPAGVPLVRPVMPAEPSEATDATTPAVWVVEVPATEDVDAFATFDEPHAVVEPQSAPSSFAIFDNEFEDALAEPPGRPAEEVRFAPFDDARDDQRRALLRPDGSSVAEDPGAGFESVTGAEADDRGPDDEDDHPFADRELASSTPKARAVRPRSTPRRTAASAAAPATPRRLPR